jgi:8-oxo-dGTP diphosphatase
MTVLKAKYCPDCGNKLSTRQHENKERRYCEACDRIIYQQPIPCADVAVIDEDQALLIKRGNPPHANMWALPGGIIEVNESPAEAAARELKEETDIDVDPTSLALIGAYSVTASEGWSNVGYSYAVSRINASGTPISGTDAQDAQFWTLRQLHESEQALRPDPDDESRIRKAMEVL